MGHNTDNKLVDFVNVTINRQASKLDIDPMCVDSIFNILSILSIFCYFSEVLQAEAQQESANPANFGPKKYCLKECMSEVEGQVPHPGLVPLPKEMTGKYRAQMAAKSQD